MNIEHSLKLEHLFEHEEDIRDNKKNVSIVAFETIFNSIKSSSVLIKLMQTLES